MNNKDVSTLIGETWFNYKVVALIEFDNKILLNNRNGWDFWNLPGGRVKTNENSETALLRELKEELGYSFDNPKLIHFLESFFEWDGKQAHELFLIYKIKIHKPNNFTEKQDFASLDNPNVVFHWFDRSEVKNIKCLPKIIYHLAEKKVNTFEHTYKN